MFYGKDVFKKVNELSGGEKIRLRWAQLVNTDYNLLVLDEPTKPFGYRRQRNHRRCFIRLQWNHHYSFT